MATCSNCGHALADRALFCSNCGTPVVAGASPAAPLPTPTPPPAVPYPSAYQYPASAPPAGYPYPASGPPAYQYPASAPPAGYPYPASGPPGYPYPSSAPPGFQPPTYEVPPPPVRTGPPLGQAFASGDWAGAVRAVLVGVGAMLGVYLLAVLVAMTRDSGSRPTASQIVGSIAQAAGLPAGGELRYSNGSFGESASVSFRPLGLTLLGFGLMALMFVRSIRKLGATTPRLVGLQAVRVAVVLLGAMLVVCLLSRVGAEELDPRLDIFSTLFFGVVTLAVALALGAVLGLPTLFPGRLGHYRALVFGPLRASLILIIIASVAGLVTLLVAMLLQSSVSSDDVVAALPLLVIFAPNIGGELLLFGMGVPLKAQSSGSSSSVSILDLTDHDGRFWALPAAVAILLIVTGVISARRSPVGASGKPIGYWLGATLPVILIILALLAPMRANGGIGSAFGINLSLGPDVLLTILFGAGFGALAGLLGSGIVGRQTAPVAYQYPPVPYQPAPVYPPAASSAPPVQAPLPPPPPPPPPAAEPPAAEPSAAVPPTAEPSA